MMLYRKSYLNNSDFYKEDYRHKVDIKSAPKATQIKPENVKYVIEEIAYWRKENHIHKWFVDNVQGGVDDCGEHKVTTEQLKALYDLCRSVVNKDKEPELALPTQGGFFFGPTDYDDSYFEGCKKTMEMIHPYLTDEENEFYYSSSW